MSKAQRQHVVGRLIGQHRVVSQEQLVALLSREGIAATQATVSRDLVDLGAIKVRAGGGESSYAIPAQPHDQRVPDEHLRRVFGEWVVEISVAGNIVVLRTPPGSAHVVGSALDRSDLVDVAGTVAGDDTLFVVVKAEVPDDHPAALLADHLRDLSGL